MGGGGDRTPTERASAGGDPPAGAGKASRATTSPGGATDTGASIWPPLPLSCASISAYTASLSTVRAPSTLPPPEAQLWTRRLHSSANSPRASAIGANLRFSADTANSLEDYTWVEQRGATKPLKTCRLTQQMARQSRAGFLVDV
ncbi:uncharacterized protein [Miscanthus floridulus]|uniref:uncharacterized protein isoform X2 n=1 Tax=Miscanthus floridulus TaxID=154761 RepID=UPI0034586D6B